MTHVRLMRVHQRRCRISKLNNKQIEPQRYDERTYFILFRHFTVACGKVSSSLHFYTQTQTRCDLAATAGTAAAQNTQLALCVCNAWLNFGPSLFPFPTRIHHSLISSITFLFSILNEMISFAVSFYCCRIHHTLDRSMLWAIFLNLKFITKKSFLFLSFFSSISFSHILRQLRTFRDN